MKTRNVEKDVGAAKTSRGTPTRLCPYMERVIDELKQDGKYPAVHTYTSTLRSFAEFSKSVSYREEDATGEARMPMREVFTPGQLKEYENWLTMQRGLSLNTVSTYMRTLQAVYNRWMLPGTRGYNPKLFADVHTRVVSQTKRSLTRDQMTELMHADTTTLSPTQRSVLAYFLLMFLFRGLPFIDLAHLRKRDVQGNTITYRRHKTGRQMTVHIPSEALPLIKEFRDKNPQSVYLFPILSPKWHNATEQYQHYQKALREFNQQLARLMRTLLPGIRVSSYTPRHTWATLAYYMGTTVGILCQSLGHSSIKVTETYLKPFGNEQLDFTNRKLISLVKRGKHKDRGTTQHIMRQKNRTGLLTK